MQATDGGGAPPGRSMATGELLRRRSRAGHRSPTAKGELRRPPEELHYEGRQAPLECRWCRPSLPRGQGASRAGRHYPPPPPPFPNVGFCCAVLLLLGFAACCKHMFQVFQMFQKNVASVSCGCCKVDLDVAMLHMFHAHVASVLSGCCTFNERFECSMQHDTDVAAGFFPHYQHIANKFFQHIF
uniref:Uncharacterized protein n=1 Tax=Setaria viridis TaxID=4556 RepID=A0A4U6TWA4_SETVI|nr:hypothetical protein SEVIR_7G175900v2 [Setaria viridis]